MDSNTPISPDMVLGKTVVTAHGERMGEVLDVGVHTMDRVKFLLVGGTDAHARDARRFGLDRIQSVDREVVIVK